MARLRDAKTLISPAIDAMVAELDPPASDGPLIALLRRQARVIDAMPDAVAVSMLPNHTGQLVKVLAELEDRARKRGRQDGPRPVNPVRELRAGHAAFMGKRGG
jgi:hypothetical protein